MPTTLWQVVRAAAVAILAVGLLLLLVRPPSLSGAAGVAELLAAAVAFVVLTTWAVVALMGRDGPDEEEFERIVQRSERLARERAALPAPTEFDLLVADAIDNLPEEFQRQLETTAVVVSTRGREHRAYGHYFGDTVARDYHEDRIVIYQDTLERDFGWDPALLADQVERVLRHELAHHLGWGEAGVRRLGL